MLDVRHDARRCEGPAKHLVEGGVTGAHRPVGGREEEFRRRRPECGFDEGPEFAGDRNERGAGTLPDVHRIV